MIVSMTFSKKKNKILLKDNLYESLNTSILIILNQ